MALFASRYENHCRGLVGVAPGRRSLINFLLVHHPRVFIPLLESKTPFLFAFVNEPVWMARRNEDHPIFSPSASKSRICVFSGMLEGSNRLLLTLRSETGGNSLPRRGKMKTLQILRITLDVHPPLGGLGNPGKADLFWSLFHEL